LGVRDAVFGTTLGGAEIDHDHTAMPEVVLDGIVIVGGSGVDH
jgi:hypothetical protein